MGLEIELPDGTILEAPDGVDPSAVAKGYLAKQQASNPRPEQPDSLWNFGGTLQQRLLRPLAPVEVGAQAVTGAIAGPLAGLAGIAQGASNTLMRSFGAKGRLPEPANVVQGVSSGLTYQPRTQLGKDLTGIAQYPFQKLGEGANYLGEKTAEATGNPMAGAAVNAGIQGIVQALIAKGLGGPSRGAGMIGEATPAFQPASPSSAGILSRILAKPTPVLGFDKQSIGASAASPMASTMNASPEIQQAVNTLTTRGKDVHPEVLMRHLEADSLPIPVRLTEGQATQDPVILSNEKNMRAKHEQLAQHFNEQHQQLVDNVQALRDQVGPDVFSTNPVEHGDTLIKSYEEMDAPIVQDIRAKYKALEDANGGDFPIDGKAFVANATAVLRKKLKTSYVPPGILSDMDRFAKGEPMTFEDFEAMRTNSAAEIRKAKRTGDGNAAAAAGIVRGALEDLPLVGAAARLKPLADVARSAAKARFDALEADPAYDAAIEGSVPPDRFVQKFIVSAPRDDVAIMRKNLAGNDAAIQTMGVSALDHLRNSAGVDVMGNGSFSQSRFNKGLTALSPKLGDLVTPGVAETLQKIGNVARHVQNQPAGSFVNNSNTLTAAAGKAAANAVEGAANFAAYGIPVGTMARRALEGRAGRKAVQQSLRPGAGLERKH